MGKAFAIDDPLAFEDFDAFFRAKGAEKACPDCGQIEWHIPAGQPELSTLRPTFLGVLTTPSGEEFFPVYITFCGNCGHVKTYAAEVVRDWRNARG